MSFENGDFFQYPVEVMIFFNTPLFSFEVFFAWCIEILSLDRLIKNYLIG